MSPFYWASAPEKEGSMGTTETREQTMQKIEFYLPALTDEQLRMVAGFIRGIQKKSEE